MSWASIFLLAALCNFYCADSVITPGFIEELDNKGRLIEKEYLDFGVTDEECDDIGEMCDPYEGL